ncbi:MAG: ferritin-like domain-containing protein [Nitrososphaerota archaeon]
MNSKGREILKVNVEKLIEHLNRAYADEWLAYYQYWLGARLAVGPMRGAVAMELAEHAKEELEHAEKLSKRIIELGGTPVLSPEEWYKVSNCGYDAPRDPCVEKLLEQNIKGEQCAIEVYNKLLEFTKEGDPVTWRLILEILEDEIEHEFELQSLLEDLKKMMKR